MIGGSVGSVTSGRDGLSPIRVVVVDDHQHVGRGVMAEVNETDGMECTWAYSMLDLVPKELRQPEHIDVLVLDLELDDGRTVERLVEEALSWGVKVVVHTGHPHEPIRNACFDLGCHGFVAKADEPGVLPRVIRSAVDGVYAESGVLHDRNRDGPEPFTPTQAKVLATLTVEQSTEGLAEMLSYSKGYIDTVVHDLLRRTGMTSRAALAVWARERRLDLLTDQR